MARRKKEFICRGTLELNGVTFFVQARNQQEAEEKARAGEWTDWDIVGAESVNWNMSADTVEINE